MYKSRLGFVSILVLVVIFISFLIIGYLFFSNLNNSSNSYTITNEIAVGEKTGLAQTKGINWQFDGESWRASENPPSCPDPLIFPSPVDLNFVSGILYPGQIRGGDYKPHGGFRFDNRSDNNIEVRAIMDGYILKASRYEVNGEVQNMIFYVNECGIMVMNDHLLTLSSKLQKVYDKIPVGKNGDSRTTEINPRVYIEKGELLATEVGFKLNKNIFLDFGLYDLRKTNGVNYDSNFKKTHPSINEYGTHALCWFDNLSSDDNNFVRSLPAGGKEGKVSDYCLL